MLLQSWIQTPVLRPSRSQLARCLRAAEEHVVERRAVAEQRAAALADCERRIESARSVVFAANDGVVSSLMTNLEREWRRLSRRDPDDGLMELWARVAPKAWTDRKLWRGGKPEVRVAFAVALASDPDGVAAAEDAAERLRAVLGGWGITMGPRIQWRSLEGAPPDTRALVEHLFASPVRVYTERLEATDAKNVVLARAHALDEAVRERVAREHDAAVAGGFGYAAFVEYLWRAVVDLRLVPEASYENPVQPLRDLWRTGYVLGDVEAGGITLLAPVDGIPLPSPINPSS